MFLEISQNSQENTCEFCEISKNTFFTEHVWATASTALYILEYQLNEGIQLGIQNPAKHPFASVAE